MGVSFDNGKVGSLVEIADLKGTSGGAGYAVMPDGDHFVFARFIPQDELPNDRIVVVLNFAAEVRRRNSQLNSAYRSSNSIDPVRDRFAFGRGRHPCYAATDCPAQP